MFMHYVAGGSMSKDGSTKWAHEQKRWAKGLNISDNQGKCVLKELVDRANVDNACWGDQAGIAYDCGKSRRTVQTHIEALAKAGYILVYERRGFRGTKLDDGYILAGYQIPTQAPHEILDCKAATLKDFTGNGCYWQDEDTGATVASGNAQPSPVAMRSDCAQSSAATSTSHVQPSPSSCYDVAHDTHITSKLHLNSKEENKLNQVGGLGELVQVWNSHCGDLPQLEHFDQSRPEAVGLQGLLRKMGLEKAKNTLRDATLGMASDSWHAEKGLGLAFLLKGQKYYQLAEKHRAAEKKSKPREYTDRELLEGNF